MPKGKQINKGEHYKHNQYIYIEREIFLLGEKEKKNGKKCGCDFQSFIQGASEVIATSRKKETALETNLEYRQYVSCSLLKMDP